MRLKQIRIIKVLIFVCCFLLLFFCVVNPILKFKYIDGIEPWTEFYKMEEDSIDVLLFGSSHMYATVNPAILWEDAGIPSFLIGGSGKPMWNIYYDIKESLKYQSPELIIIEPYSTLFDWEYVQYSGIIKNTFGLKFSRNKIDSIKASAQEEYWQDLILGFPAYHGRYGELNKNDFSNFTGKDGVYMNGYISSANYTKQVPVDVSGINEKNELPEKHLEYLIKTIDLLNENDIELMIIVSPYITSANDQASYNMIEKIALENNIKFVNYNLLYDELDLDFNFDMMEKEHLTYTGGAKVSHNIANILKNEYALENKKDFNDYEKWNEWAQEVFDTIQNNITKKELDDLQKKTAEV